MSQRGVTLIEMLLVVTLIGLMAGVTYPSVSSGIDSLRLRSASDAVASLLNGAVNRAERRAELVEVSIFSGQGKLMLRSTEPGFERTLELPQGIAIRSVLPEPPGGPEDPRRIVMFPGGTVPRIAIELVNRKGIRRLVRIDPITGVPQVEP